MTKLPIWMLSYRANFCTVSKQHKIHICQFCDKLNLNSASVSFNSNFLTPYLSWIVEESNIDSFLIETANLKTQIMFFVVVQYTLINVYLFVWNFICSVWMVGAARAAQQRRCAIMTVNQADSLLGSAVRRAREKSPNMLVTSWIRSSGEQLRPALFCQQRRVCDGLYVTARPAWLPHYTVRRGSDY